MKWTGWTTHLLLCDSNRAIDDPIPILDRNRRLVSHSCSIGLRFHHSPVIDHGCSTIMPWTTPIVSRQLGDSFDGTIKSILPCTNHIKSTPTSGDIWRHLALENQTLFIQVALPSPHHIINIEPCSLRRLRRCHIRHAVIALPGAGRGRLCLTASPTSRLNRISRR